MEDIADAKIRNILDMAYTFSAMPRVFEKASKTRIVQRLHTAFKEFTTVADQTDFDNTHSAFCEWFVVDIKTAERQKGRVIAKPSGPTSYGQAAKLFDVASKVYVYYCHLPDRDTAARLLPLLHGAVDTAIMKYLKSRYPECGINASAIIDIDRISYTSLQRLIARNIKEDFNEVPLHPVQYDDIMWYRLNR